MKKLGIALGWVVIWLIITKMVTMTFDHDLPILGYVVIGTVVLVVSLATKPKQSQYIPNRSDATK